MVLSKKIPFAVIGPTTANAAREKNFKPIIQPKNSEIESFVDFYLDMMKQPGQIQKIIIVTFQI